MIKKYGSLINILLILILSFITVKAIQIKNEKEEISELFTGETTMYLEQIGLSYEQYQEVANQIADTKGITMTNTNIENNDERQTTLFIDQVYYNNYLSKMQVNGNAFEPTDFTIEFTSETEIPVIINAKFAIENNLSVGDVTTIENYLPNVCEFYSNDIIYSNSIDGTAIKEKETDYQNQCNRDETYEYLLNDNGFAEIPVKVIGIFENEDRPFPGFPMDIYPIVDVIAPRFILKNSNEDKYDLQKYRSGEFTLMKSQVIFFVDYNIISDAELNKKIQDIEEKIGTKIFYEKVTDWMLFVIEDNIHMYNQALVNYIFIGNVIVVLWLVQLYYRLIYFQYECGVLCLLGVPRKQILSYHLKKNIKLSMLILLLVVLIGFIFEMLVYTLAYYILLSIIEQITFKRYATKVNQDNLNQILIGGNL